MNRTWTVALFVGGVALIATLVWLRRQPSQDPEAIAEQYREALLSGDADTVLRLAAPDEFRQNGMTRKDVDRFLNGWLRQKVLRGLDPRFHETISDGTGSPQTYHYGIVTRDGSLNLAVTVAKTDSGLKVVQPLTTIVVTFAVVRRGGPVHPGGRDKLAAYAENGPKLAAELAPYHLQFICLAPGDAPMTIEQFGVWSRERLTRLDASAAGR